MADNEEPAAEVDHSTRAAELVSIFKALGALPSQHMDEAWSRLLNIPRSSGEFYSALASVARSIDTLKAEIADSHLRDASKNTYLDAAGQLSFYVQTHRLRELTTGNLRAETDAFRLLTLLDDVLPPTANRFVPKATLAEWLQTVQEMIDSSQDAISDPVLRGFVVRQLTQLQWAINNYKWLGIDGISRSYGAMAAELARSTSMKGAQTPEARSWFQRVKKPIIAMGVGIAATSAVVEQSDKLLTHGGHIYEAITAQVSEKPTNAKSPGTALTSSTNLRKLPGQ
ncbi:hypothetical protein IFT54_05630 [Sphingomonas sp. CFBP 13714]|uniref:hypothetical protein n=1 Tax=Sphingomonas sp. CFBP 13714 TaxID=2775308 RepID=UPI0017848BF6|nr:hypothetical protein [Sphingomonas sp. CFBP 13714]MBD8699295.1 hypothetical protein [Sphingomonas sp. CFBP 13714]